MPGGIRELQTEQAVSALRKEGINVDPKQSTLFAQTSMELRDIQQAGQKILNEKLQLYMQNPGLSANKIWYDPNDLENSRMITPSRWIKETKDLRSDYFKGKEFMAEYADVFKFPDAIQVQSKEVIQKYYDQLATAAGRIENTNTQAQILLSAYYSIPTPEDDAGAGKSWVEYFEERREMEEFIRGFGETTYKQFNALKSQYNTPSQDNYENYIRYKQPYFDIGKDLSELFV